MSINNIVSQYYTELDEVDKRMIDEKVAEKGIEEYLNQQLIYLDCTRIIQGMRMMQTIGYPYKREIMSYAYALSGLAEDPDYEQKWINKLIERHNANLEYERTNPPVWYDGKPKKVCKRKQKNKEGDIFPEETKKAKISKAEAKLKAKFVSVASFGSFKINKK